jgi:exodeoxyribonuclease VII large subunit
MGSAILQRVSQRVEREAQTLDQLALRLAHALPNPDRMREQITAWQKRLNQAWMVRVQGWKQDQMHHQSQLEMLNPQRTLERGYAVILSKEKEAMFAVRKASELQPNTEFEIRLAQGTASVEFASVKKK